MTSNHRPIDDRPAHQLHERETLCALFDGELQGDEARFALKRLGHDVQWRDTVGRWQLYGDALRGQVQGVAASDFADRVALALRDEQAQVVAIPARASGGRRAWMGGALAASVAVAALFVTRPFSSDAPPSGARVSPNVASVPAAAPRVAAAVASRAPSAAASGASVLSGATNPQSPGSTLGASAAAAAVAAVEVPRRVSERRSTRNQNPRSVDRIGRSSQQPVVATAGIAPTAIADAGLPASNATSHKPFQPEHVEPASRPWPRAVLPQYSGNGALTASFGTSTATSPSFYPFEPQAAMPVEETPAQRDSQD